jgi:AcrR family transcriptional regulator
MDEKETTPAPLSGRRAEATRNDQRILDAAREVFVGDPGAPIAAVAKRAGVGIGALYRRCASKEELLQRLSAQGVQQYIITVVRENAAGEYPDSGGRVYKDTPYEITVQESIFTRRGVERIFWSGLPSRTESALLCLSSMRSSARSPLTTLK